MSKSEQKIQQECVIWFNNNYCLKHSEPRCTMFSVPNEIGMVIRGAMLREGIRPSVVNKIIAIVMRNMKRTGLSSGVSDTIVCLPSKVLFVEFKTSTGRQSKNQSEFEEVVDNLGLPYYIIRSLEEFQKLIKEHIE